MKNGAFAIFHNIFKDMIFQRCQKGLLWNKGLNITKRQGDVGWGRGRIYPFYSGIFPHLRLINLYRSYMNVQNHLPPRCRKKLEIPLIEKNNTQLVAVTVQPLYNTSRSGL